MKISFRNMAGILLVLIGFLLAISNLEIFGEQAQNVGSVLIFGILGAIFLYYYRRHTAEKWILVASITAFGLALVRVLGLFWIEEGYLAALSLLVLALMLFGLVFVDGNNWWAIIPAFLLLALGFSDYASLAGLNYPLGGSLFLGVGLAFLVLFFLPKKFGNASWSLVPAALLLSIGSIARYQDVHELSGYLVPGLLLLAGVAVLIYALRKPA